MSRQQSLEVIWKRLLMVLATLGVASVLIVFLGGRARISALIFLVGNIGGYVGVHRSLRELSDTEVQELASSWLGMIAPSFVGGILAWVLYLAFLGNLIAGAFFPIFEPDVNSPKGFESLLTQHGKEMMDYAKLLFWSFVAGFNQKYVVDVIDSIKSRT